MTTAASLRKTHRRQDRRADAKRRALSKMAEGASLHRCFVVTGRTALSGSSAPVSHELAFDLLSDARVVGVGDCLLGKELSQTFRYVDNEKSRIPGAVQ